MNRLEKRQLKPHWLQRRRRLLGGEEAGGLAGGGIPEAPLTGGPFGRYQETWVEVPPEAPKDSQLYGRINDTWQVIPAGGGGGLDQATADGLYVNVNGDTMTGSLALPLGTAAATAVHFGTPGTGIFGVSTNEIRITTVGTARLSIGGNIQSLVQNTGVNGAQTAPTYSFTGNANTGLYRGATANNCSIATNGTETMRWTGADNSTLALGPLMVSADPTANLQVASKQYVDNKFSVVVGGAEISDTAPTAQQGKLWWESDAGGLWLSYNDGNTTQWIGVGGNVAQGNYVSKAGDTITGNISITAPTVSGTPTSGALVVTGGVGIGGALNIAGAVNHNSTTQMGAALTLFYSSPGIVLDRPTVAASNCVIDGRIAGLNKWAISLADSIAMTGGNAGANFSIARFADTTGAYLDSPLEIKRDTGRVILASNISSTSPTTGALTVNGGVGVGGDIRIGGAFHGGSAFAATGPMVTLQLRCSVAGTGNGCAISMATDTNTKWWFGYRSALYGTAYDDNFIGWNPDTGPFLEITQLTGQVKLPKTTASTSPTTGAFVVSGGVGISGALHLTGSINLGNAVPIIWKGLDGVGRPIIQSYENNTYLDCPHSGNIYFRSGPTVGAVNINMTLNGAGHVNVNNTTASTSPTTGALVVAGGVGVAGTVYAGGVNIENSSATLTINAASGSRPQIYWRVNGTQQWHMTINNANGIFALLDSDESHGVQMTQDSSAWVSASDKRLRHKQNARTVSGLLDKIDRFRLVEFGKDHSEIGVIAQELNTFLPQLVVNGDDDDDRIIDRVSEDGVWAVKPSEAAFVALQIGKELYERIQEIERLMKVH